MKKYVYGWKFSCGSLLDSEQTSIKNQASAANDLLPCTFTRRSLQSRACQK